MKEIERRALMGDQEAQRELTENGIVLPCPICHKPVKVSVSRMLYACASCHITVSFNSFYVKPEDTLRIWNRRTAPPIGKCKDCKHQGTGDSDICHSDMDDEFCSGFDPKEDAK